MKRLLNYIFCILAILGACSLDSIGSSFYYSIIMLIVGCSGIYVLNKDSITLD
jgi:hypothetical protein